MKSNLKTQNSGFQTCSAIPVGGQAVEPPVLHMCAEHMSTLSVTADATVLSPTTAPTLS